LIAKEEQKLLYQSVVGVAGTGGMGGHVAQALTRVGVGHIKIADTEEFDVSNLNRQSGANLYTLNKSKALETGRQCRNITEDFRLGIYASGITEASAEHFVQDCDIVCDEVEFWATGSRTFLHQKMRQTDATSFTCSSIGFGTVLTKFNAGSMHMEEVLEMDYSEAMSVQKRISTGTSSREEIERTMTLMLRLAAPIIPEYCDPEQYSTVEEIKRRLREEVRASIIGTNPLFAAGFLANHIVLELLRRKSPIRRIVPIPPVMPGYVRNDSWLQIYETQVGKWW
ncbi:MAG: molybdopterin biosynthesis MoeB protein, partial [Candidatus Nomurabacteria bacterium]|nr:molybdopterin biosynthesis MoeB protein [Candidatus Nomurabacteria bacterium]